MSFFFNDFFGGGGMPGGGFHGHGMGGDDSDDEPVDTEKFYKLLDIPKDATQDQIKKAYRKKAKSLHPDRHQQEREKYQALFQEVQAAHEVLRDPQKRALYDKYGEKGVKRGGGGGGRGGGGLFEQMFGQQRGGGHESGPKKSPTIKMALEVTLEDIYCGSTKNIKINRRVAGSESATCPKCHGSGQITQIQRMGPMVLQQRRECPLCGGIGYKLDREEHEIEFHVPIGGRDRESVTINGEGNQYPDMAPGDVVVQLRVASHSMYKRQGADLGMNYTLSLRQALCGYKIKIPHVSGRTLVITALDTEEVVQPGSLKVVHCKGVPQRFNPHIKGHLYIVMEVEMPKPRTLSTKTIGQFALILPDQELTDENEGDEEEEEDEKQRNGSNQTQNQNGSNSKGKQSMNNQRGKKGPKGRQSRNQRKNNRRKNGKNKNQKKGKKGGVFGGLQGAFGGDQGPKQKGNGKGSHSNSKLQGMELDEEDDDDLMEEVECHSVDGNPKATPAAANNYYDQDDDDGEGVQCRQM